MTNPAVAYIRVSTQGQLDGYGFDAQEARVRRYAQSNSLDIDRVFREEAVTGTTEAESRIAWVQALDYMAESGIKTIIIPELSRLARDLMIQESIIRDVSRQGLMLLSVAEPDLLSNDPSRKLVRQIMGAINEYEREIIIARIAAGRLAKAIRGEHSAGCVPLGYAIEPTDNGRKRLVPDESEASTVALIYQLYAEGWTLLGIAKRLNEIGVKPKKWTPEKPTQFYASTIKAVLGNKKYVGMVEFRQGGKVVSQAENLSLKIIG